MSRPFLLLCEHFEYLHEDPRALAVKGHRKVFCKRLTRRILIRDGLTHMSNPKNCINLSLAPLVLLLKYARVSSIPCKTLPRIDIEMTVEPELYSMIR